MARHWARRDEDAEDIEQLGWRRYFNYLPKVDPELPAFPLLAKCLRTAAVDYYRVAGNREVPVGDEDRPEIPAPPDRIEIGDHKVYSELLGMAFSREGGPAHERLAFWPESFDRRFPLKSSPLTR